MLDMRVGYSPSFLRCVAARCIVIDERSERVAAGDELWATLCA